MRERRVRDGMETAADIRESVRRATGLAVGLALLSAFLSGCASSRATGAGSPARESGSPGLSAQGAHAASPIAARSRVEASGTSAATAADAVEEKWGIRPLGIRLSAAGYMLDFRYRLLDPDKAVPILDHKVKPYLIDQKSGAKFQVPTPPKVGALRQTSRRGKPAPDRNYFVFFANPGKTVKPGDRVTVVIGNFRAENLIVQ